MPGAGIELGAFLLVGLLGGAHCLGMCGPLVTTYTPSDGRVTLHDVRQQGLFTFGRVGTYAAVGALFGALGATAIAGGSLFAAADLVRGTVGVTAGLVVLAVGIGYLRGDPVHATVAMPDGGAVARLTGAVAERADGWAKGPRIVLLGAFHALLPCPLLYPAYLYAFARGSPTAGALALGALGIGTAPAMVGYATLIGAVPAAVRGRLHRALGAAFLALGLLPLLHGLSVLGVPVPSFQLPHYTGVPSP